MAAGVGSGSDCTVLSLAFRQHRPKVVRQFLVGPGNPAVQRVSVGLMLFVRCCRRSELFCSLVASELNCRWLEWANHSRVALVLLALSSTQPMATSQVGMREPLLSDAGARTALWCIQQYLMFPLGARDYQAPSYCNRRKLTRR